MSNRIEWYSAARLYACVLRAAGRQASHAPAEPTTHGFEGGKIADVARLLAVFVKLTAVLRCKGTHELDAFNMARRESQRAFTEIDYMFASTAERLSAQLACAASNSSKKDSLPC